MDEHINLPPLHVATCILAGGILWLCTSWLLAESFQQSSNFVFWDTLYKSLFILVSGLIIYFQGRQHLEMRSEYKSQLETALREKEILTREIHHRVKNNLAVISGLIELQGFDIPDRRVREVIEDSLMRIQSIARVHEGLYESKSFSNVSNLEFIENLIEEIKKRNDTAGIPIYIQKEIDEMSININQAVPCALLLNELLTNAYQHAFDEFQPDTGLIFVGMKSEGQTVDIIIEDNGRGLPEGFRLKKADTIGCNLIRILVKQLKGQMQFDSKPREGTRFHIQFRKMETKGSKAAVLDPDPGIMKRPARGSLYSYA